MEKSAEQSSENAEKDITVSLEGENAVEAQYSANNAGSTTDEAEVKKAKILALLKAGFSVAEIVETQGVSKSYAYKLDKARTDKKPKEKTAGQVFFEQQAAAMVEAGEALEGIDALQARKQKFIEALFNHHGVVVDAQRVIGIYPATYYRWLNDDPVFKQRVAEVQEASLDYVESQLFQQIAMGNPSSTQFYLKTKGKHRGYTEKLEIAGDQDAPLTIKVIEPYVDPLADVEEGEDVIEGEFQVVEPGESA